MENSLFIQNQKLGSRTQTHAHWTEAYEHVISHQKADFYAVKVMLWTSSPTGMELFGYFPSQIGELIP